MPQEKLQNAAHAVDWITHPGRAPAHSHSRKVRRCIHVYVGISKSKMANCQNYYSKMMWQIRLYRVEVKWQPGGTFVTICDDYLMRKKFSTCREKSIFATSYWQ